MGMGYGASYADSVDEEFVKEVCPKELKKFRKALEDYFNTDDAESETMVYQDILPGFDTVEGTEGIMESYEALCEAFEKKTGLTLELGYHNSDDEGDRYDDVNGEFWCVGGVYQYTEAGKKYSDKVKRVHYVTFG